MGMGVLGADGMGVGFLGGKMGMGLMGMGVLGEDGDGGGVPGGQMGMG